MDLAKFSFGIGAACIDAGTLGEVIDITDSQRGFGVVVLAVDHAFGIAIAKIGLERTAEGRNVGTERHGMAVNITRGHVEVGEGTTEALERGIVRGLDAHVMVVFTGSVDLGDAEVIRCTDEEVVAVLLFAPVDGRARAARQVGPLVGLCNADELEVADAVGQGDRNLAVGGGLALLGLDIPTVGFLRVRLEGVLGVELETSEFGRGVGHRVVETAPVGDMEVLAADMGAPTAGEDAEAVHQAVGTVGAHQCTVQEAFPALVHSSG